MNKIFYVVKVETIWSCTRKCDFCKFWSWFNNDNTSLSWNIIKKILFELKEIKFKWRLSWFWMNEPLLDDRIYDIIKLSREELPYAFLSLQTNWDLLTLDNLKLLYKNGLNSLWISIYDNSTFIKIWKIVNDKSFLWKVVLKDYRNIKNLNIENRGWNIQGIKYVKEDILWKNCLRPSSTIYINNKWNIKLCEWDINNSNINYSLDEFKLFDAWNSNIFNKYRCILSTNWREWLIPCNKCSYKWYRSNPFFPLKHPDTL